MVINAETKVAELLERYPFLLDFLVGLSPEFQKLRDPVLRETMGRHATLSLAAAVGGLDISDLLANLARRIQEEAGPPDQDQRRAAIKGIIRDLHAGADLEGLKARFRETVRGLEASELASIEQQLINEGLPVEEVKRLCDVHVAIFKEALEARESPATPPGHPIHTFMKENRAAEKVLSNLNLLLGKIHSSSSREPFGGFKAETAAFLELLGQIDRHYQRKENQLFPLLEAHHFTGPSQVMWSVHDDIREMLRKAKAAVAEDRTGEALGFLSEAGKAVREMIFKEEHILFPASLDLLSESEWVRVKEGEAEIGYAWTAPDEGWPGRAAPEEAPPVSVPPPDRVGALGLETGRLTPEQINLLINHLPVDVTFVDENDRVAFFSAGKERIFPRSEGIIGREVRNCHPPKSVHKVNQILDAFKSGARDTAEFWIEQKGRFLFIRYLAVRDKAGEYKGCLEVTQDVTGIRRLEGQKRLLDWD
ncbi:MAG: DUF438 domain-containing protein [Thermodesulfobacteriota bacterium]